MARRLPGVEIAAYATARPRRSRLIAFGLPALPLPLPCTRPCTELGTSCVTWRNLRTGWISQIRSLVPDQSPRALAPSDHRRRPGARGWSSRRGSSRGGKDPDRRGIRREGEVTACAPSQRAGASLLFDALGGLGSGALLGAPLSLSHRVHVSLTSSSSRQSVGQRDAPSWLIARATGHQGQAPSDAQSSLPLCVARRPLRGSVKSKRSAT